MKVIDSTETEVAPQSKKGFLDLSRLKPGGSPVKENEEAQDYVVNALNKVLDNQFVLLRNITLEGLDIPIPLILLGPGGIQVIYASTAKGVYRAKEGVWEKLDDRSGRFQIDRPNLLERSMLMARALETFLTNQKLELPVTEPVLFFSDPGIHIDATRPIVRVLMADALDRYIAGLVTTRSFIDQETVQRVVKILTRGLDQKGAEGQTVIERDAFSFMDLPEEGPQVRKKVIVDRSEPPVFQSIPFTKRQWLMLILLVVVNIIILAGLVIFVLMSS
jgi:hypothetical protein